MTLRHSDTFPKVPLLGQEDVSWQMVFSLPSLPLAVPPCHNSSDIDPTHIKPFPLVPFTHEHDLKEPACMNLYNQSQLFKLLPLKLFIQSQTYKFVQSSLTIQVTTYQSISSLLTI
jgi:hypothetical protein